MSFLTAPLFPPPLEHSQQVKTIRLRLCSYVIAAPLHALIEARLNEGFRFVVSSTSGGGGGASRPLPAAGSPLPSAVLVQLWQPQVLLLYLPTATHRAPGSQSPSAVRVDLDVLARSDFCQLLHGLRRLHAREIRLSTPAVLSAPPVDIDTPGSVSSASALLLAVASIDTELGAAATAVRRIPLTANPGPDVMSERFALRQSPLAVDRRRIVALSQFVHALTQVDAVSEKLASPPLGAYHSSLVQYFGRRSAVSHAPDAALPSLVGSDCDGSSGSDATSRLRVLLPVPMARLFIPLASLSVAAWHRWFHVERLEVVMRVPSLPVSSGIISDSSDYGGAVATCWGCALLRHVQACMQRWADVELPWSREVFHWQQGPTASACLAKPTAQGPLVKVVWPEAVRAALAGAQRGDAAPAARDAPQPPPLFPSAGGLRSSATVVSGFSDARSKKARTSAAPRGGRAPPAISVAAHVEDRLASQLLLQIPKPLPFVFVRVAAPAPQDDDGPGMAPPVDDGSEEPACCCRDRGSALVVIHVALYGLPPPARTEALRSLRSAVSGDILLRDYVDEELNAAEAPGRSRADAAADRLSDTEQGLPDDAFPRIEASAGVVRAVPDICVVPLARMAMRGDTDFLFHWANEQRAWAEGEGADFFEVPTAGVAPAASGCAGSALPPSVLRSALTSRCLRWELPTQSGQQMQQLTIEAALHFRRLTRSLVGMATPDVGDAGKRQRSDSWQRLVWSGCACPGRGFDATAAWSDAASVPVVLGRAHLYQRIAVGAPSARSLAQLQAAVVLLPPGFNDGRPAAGSAVSLPTSARRRSTVVEARTSDLSGAGFGDDVFGWRAEVRMQVWLEGRSAAALRVCEALCASLAAAGGDAGV